MPGYKFKDLKYTVTSPKGSVGYAHRSVKGRGKTVGAGVDAGAWAVNFAHNIVVKRNVDREIEKTAEKSNRCIGRRTVSAMESR